MTTSINTLLMTYSSNASSKSVYTASDVGALVGAEVGAEVGVEVGPKVDVEDEDALEVEPHTAIPNTHSIAPISMCRDDILLATLPLFWSLFNQLRAVATLCRPPLY